MPPRGSISALTSGSFSRSTGTTISSFTIPSPLTPPSKAPWRGPRSCSPGRRCSRTGRPPSSRAPGSPHRRAGSGSAPRDGWIATGAPGTSRTRRGGRCAWWSIRPDPTSRWSSPSGRGLAHAPFGSGPVRRPGTRPLDRRPRTGADVRDPLVPTPRRAARTHHRERPRGAPEPSPRRHLAEEDPVQPLCARRELPARRPGPPSSEGERRPTALRGVTRQTSTHTCPSRTSQAQYQRGCHEVPSGVYPNSHWSRRPRTLENPGAGELVSAGGWHALAQRVHGFDRLREHAHAAREHATRPKTARVELRASRIGFRALCIRFRLPGSLAFLIPLKHVSEDLISRLADAESGVVGEPFQSPRKVRDEPALGGFIEERERADDGKEPRKNKLSIFSLVGQPPSAVIICDSRGRLSHIQGHACAELINLFFRGA